MECPENLDWQAVMNERVRSLTAKSVNGYTHWIDKALLEFNFLNTSYYLEQKEIVVDCQFCNN
tara:strand:- start:594 stop:782 length:189 start_codon:yes stop_codon:yes gene_type:complete